MLITLLVTEAVKIYILYLLRLKLAGCGAKKKSAKMEGVVCNAGKQYLEIPCKKKKKS